MTSLPNRRSRRALDAGAFEYHSETCPKACALIVRCWVVLEKLLDEEKRGEIHGLLVALGPIARSGHDIDATDYWGDFEAQCEEMLGRAEAAVEKRG